MKRKDKIKQVIRSKLQEEERNYSFVVEKRKMQKVKADNFGNALDKVLSLNPSKRVRYNLKFYLMAEQEGMDLMSAKVAAASKSKSTGKKVYIFMDGEGDHYLADSAVKGTIACYSNGGELAEERPTAPVTPATKAEVRKSAIVKEEKEQPVKKSNETKKEKVMAKTTKKSAKKVAAKKVTAPAKKAAKPASNLVSKATTLSLTPAQWAKLEKLGSIRDSANTAVIAYHKL